MLAGPADDAVSLLAFLAALPGGVHQLKALRDTRGGELAWEEEGPCGVRVGGPGSQGPGLLTRLQVVLQGTEVQVMTLSCVALSLRSVQTQFWHLDE